MVDIFKICGFYNKKKGAFLFRVFEIWVAESFDVGTLTTFCYPGSPHKKIPLIKIGPSHPASQLKEKLDPPTFRLQTDPKG
jgi:hypothetical protein